MGVDQHMGRDERTCRCGRIEKKTCSRTSSATDIAVEIEKGSGVSQAVFDRKSPPQPSKRGLLLYLPYYLPNFTANTLGDRLVILWFSGKHGRRPRSTHGSAVKVGGKASWGPGCYYEVAM